MTFITGENLIASLNNTAVGNYSYAYDANDNKTAETISGVMSGYGFDTPSGYDDEDRLTNWERDDANLDLSWVLSDVGDWDSHTTNTVTENRTHNAVHELTAIASTSLTYDAKGNLTSDEAGIDYTWDMDNMLNEADVPSSPSRGIEGTHTYAYDALGRRASKMVDDAVAMTSETTVFVSGDNQVLAEYDSGTASSAPLRKYAYGSYIDEPLVLIDRTAAGTTAAGTDEPFYYHRNQQYSLVALSNSSGTITERYHYTPYSQTTILAPNGTTTRTVSDAGNSYTYTGRGLDRESGLHYFRARQFQDSLGRFVSRDPLTYIDGFSLYRGFFIPSGMDPWGLAGLFGQTWVAPWDDNANWSVSANADQYGRALGVGASGALTGAAAGATTGAMAGAVVGSVVPGPGTLAGAGAGASSGAIGGAIGGLFSAAKSKSPADAALNSVLPGAMGGIGAGVAGPLLGAATTGGGGAALGFAGGGSTATGTALTAGGVAATTDVVAGVVGLGTAFTHRIDPNDPDSWDDHDGGYVRNPGGDNTTANSREQFIVDDVGLNQSQADQLHRLISKKGYSREEIRRIAEQIKFGKCN